MYQSFPAPRCSTPPTGCGAPMMISNDRFIYKYVTVEQCRPQCLELWLAVRADFLPEWVQEHAGERPSWWYEFDAPRMDESELETHGWRGAYFAPRVYQPRRRVGGTGLADFERYSRMVPVFIYGIPARWHSIDPADPPRFESQASYLQRHGLFVPHEEERLSAEDFE